VAHGTLVPDCDPSYTTGLTALSIVESTA
jgi:hypothetical protein